MLEVLGLPSSDFIMESKKRLTYFDHHRRPYVFPNSKGERRVPGSKTLKELLKCDDNQFVNFISSCLRWEPRTRISAEECSRHPFILADENKNDGSGKKSPRKSNVPGR